jgi:hypothetical protein
MFHFLSFRSRADLDELIEKICAHSYSYIPKSEILQVCVIERVSALLAGTPVQAGQKGKLFFCKAISWEMDNIHG